MGSQRWQVRLLVAADSRPYVSDGACKTTSVTQASTHFSHPDTHLHVNTNRKPRLHEWTGPHCSMGSAGRTSDQSTERLCRVMLSFSEVTQVMADLNSNQPTCSKALSHSLHPLSLLSLPFYSLSIVIFFLSILSTFSSSLPSVLSFCSLFSLSLTPLLPFYALRPSVGEIMSVCTTAASELGLGSVQKHTHTPNLPVFWTDQATALWLKPLSSPA